MTILNRLVHWWYCADCPRVEPEAVRNERLAFIKSTCPLWWPESWKIKHAIVRERQMK